MTACGTGIWSGQEGQGKPPFSKWCVCEGGVKLKKEHFRPRKQHVQSSFTLKKKQNHIDNRANGCCLGEHAFQWRYEDEENRQVTQSVGHVRSLCKSHGKPLKGLARSPLHWLQCRRYLEKGHSWSDQCHQQALAVALVRGISGLNWGVVLKWKGVIIERQLEDKSTGLDDR